MPNFAKKCKKQLRRILIRRCFSCVCVQENKDPNETSSSSDKLVSQKLEVLLLNNLRYQLEERQYRDQLRQTLVHVTKVLEDIRKRHDTQQKLSQHDNFSQFTITFSENNLIHCQPHIRNASLIVLNGENIEATGKRSVVLHKCQNEIFDVPKRAISQGSFSSILYKKSDDKAVQYDPKFNFETSLAENSKLIQTQLLNLSNFNIAAFKVNLVKHIRNLKQDVISLRQLLYGVENFSTQCTVDLRSGSIFGSDRQENEFEYKFMEAKIRAANFVKFYKLRKIGDKKKTRNKITGRKELR